MSIHKQNQGGYQKAFDMGFSLIKYDRHSRVKSKIDLSAENKTGELIEPGWIEVKFKTETSGICSMEIWFNNKSWSISEIWYDIPSKQSPGTTHYQPASNLLVMKSKLDEALDFASEFITKKQGEIINSR